MKMRMPAIPLITIDPYFSVWTTESANKQTAYHWTGKPNTILGLVKIDGEEHIFLGRRPEIKEMPIVSIDADALSSKFVYKNEKIRLTAVYTSPLIATDLYLSSRPVSYLNVSYESVDGNEHTVSVKICVSEELVLNTEGEGRAVSKNVDIENISCIRMGNGIQKVLNRAGDDIRIDWGYFYLAVKGDGCVDSTVVQNYVGWGKNAKDIPLYAVYAEKELKNDALFMFAYDDIESITYFGENLKAYWKKDGKDIVDVIKESAEDYQEIMERCNAFAKDMYDKAYSLGGEKYAELVSLAYRQVMAAHKLVKDNDGNNLYISKECYSNGCAATVDVTYPSSPMYLYYNVELLKGMLRPILKMVRTDLWKDVDFAPHDVGTYPILNGQVYYAGPTHINVSGQMPVEECGNMLILLSAICQKENSTGFVKDYLDLLEKWSKHLINYGEDPEEQLCTDDFAGRLPHNCNLSIKAIMGLVGYSKILEMLGETQKAEEIFGIAKKYANSFLERAKNSDGSYRLAYDKPDTFSLKYNAVWDLVWGTKVFPESFYENELKRYFAEALPFGVPLDSRAKYTKSDWLHYVSCFAKNKEDFEKINGMLWNAYDNMSVRVPMSDWYFASTSEFKSFKARTVQGGLFLKFLF